MYPSAAHTYNGIHVKEQIDHLLKHYPIDHQLYFINGFSSKINYFKSIFIANKLIAKKKFDLVHIHFGLSGLFVLFNPFINIPVILTIHGSDINSTKLMGLMKRITKRVAKRAKKIIILNEKMERLLLPYKERTVIIPCGINIDQFALNRNNKKKCFLVGFPGDKQRPVKNYILFEKIIDQLKIKGHEIEIIEFHNLSRAEVAEQLSRLDCLLMTSHSEGSPQIIKEAMVCNVPIVSSNVGDVGFVLDDVKNCYVIDSFGVEDYVEKLILLINTDQNSRITNGREKIRKLGLDQDAVCSKIFDLYESVING